MFCQIKSNPFHSKIMFLPPDSSFGALNIWKVEVYPEIMVITFSRSNQWFVVTDYIFDAIFSLEPSFKQNNLLIESHVWVWRPHALLNIYKLKSTVSKAWRTRPDKIKLLEVFQEILVCIAHNNLVIRKEVLVNRRNLGVKLNSS